MDRDVWQGGTFAHIDLEFRAGNVGVVKTRVDWPMGTDLPQPDEKAFLPDNRAVRMHKGCRLVGFDIRNWTGPPVDIIPWDTGLVDWPSDGLVLPPRGVAVL